MAFTAESPPAQGQCPHGTHYIVFGIQGACAIQIFMLQMVGYEIEKVVDSAIGESGLLRS